MAPSCTPADLHDEERIVWVMSIDGIAYVREGTYLTTQRRGRVRAPGGLGSALVGYAEVTRKPGPGIKCYQRRVFWLAAHDRHFDPTGVYAEGAPCEAVDPRTVAAGVPGECTERAWGSGESGT